MDNITEVLTSDPKAFEQLVEEVVNKEVEKYREAMQTKPVQLKSAIKDNFIHGAILKEVENRLNNSEDVYRFSDAYAVVPTLDKIPVRRGENYEYWPVKRIINWSHSDAIIKAYFPQVMIVGKTIDGHRVYSVGHDHMFKGFSAAHKENLVLIEPKG